MKDKYVKLKDTMYDMFLDVNFIFLEIDDYHNNFPTNTSLPPKIDDSAGLE